MHRRTLTLIILLLAAVLPASIAFARPSAAAELSCEGTLIRVTWGIAPDGIEVIYHESGQPNNTFSSLATSGTALIGVSSDTAVTYGLTVFDGPSSSQQVLFEGLFTCQPGASGSDDGRINPSNGDVTTVRVYPGQEEGSIVIYAIIDGEGVPTFNLNRAAVIELLYAANGEGAQGNVPLAESNGIQLWYLGATNELQINASDGQGHTYVSIFTLDLVLVRSFTLDDAGNCIGGQCQP